MLSTPYILFDHTVLSLNHEIFISTQEIASLVEHEYTMYICMLLEDNILHIRQICQVPPGNKGRTHIVRMTRAF